jgi:hypothetical protein
MSGRGCSTGGIAVDWRGVLATTAPDGSATKATVLGRNLLAVLALLLFLGVPNYLNRHRIIQRNVCRAQLQAIADAEARWANETQARRGDVAPADALLRHLKHGRMPSCPAGGTYTVNPAGTPPACSLGPALGHQL